MPWTISPKIFVLQPRTMFVKLSLNTHVLISYQEQKPECTPHKGSVFGMMLNNDIAYNSKTADLIKKSLKCLCPRISRQFNFVFDIIRSSEQIGELRLRTIA